MEIKFKIVDANHLIKRRMIEFSKAIKIIINNKIDY